MLLWPVKFTLDRNEVEVKNQVPEGYPSLSDNGSKTAQFGTLNKQASEHSDSSENGLKVNVA